MFQAFDNDNNLDVLYFFALPENADKNEKINGGE